ncbi:hypothetical protein XENOCAPTIV_013114 [Xenoophorus captivus]|uniref:Uncharacterized protein n=1 Tax=Xenoophorus captivus TaxID=1517983 RepID=A0ABV0RIW1_9TELE
MNSAGIQVRTTSCFWCLPKPPRDGSTHPSMCGSNRGAGRSSGLKPFSGGWSCGSGRLPAITTQAQKHGSCAQPTPTPRATPPPFAHPVLYPLTQRNPRALTNPVSYLQKQEPEKHRVHRITEQTPSCREGPGEAVSGGEGCEEASGEGRTQPGFVFHEYCSYSRIHPCLTPVRTVPSCSRASPGIQPSKIHCKIRETRRLLSLGRCAKAWFEADTVGGGTNHALRRWRYSQRLEGLQRATAPLVGICRQQ